MLGVFFCATFIELVAPQAGSLVLNVLSGFLVFVWYCRDRDASGRRRSLLRNLGIIMLPFIAVPWYLMRHRPVRQKARALLRFLGFGGLILLARLAGALVTALLAGLMGLHFDPIGTMQAQAGDQLRRDARKTCCALHWRSAMLAVRLYSSASQPPLLPLATVFRGP